MKSIIGISALALIISACGSASVPTAPIEPGGGGLPSQASKITLDRDTITIGSSHSVSAGAYIFRGSVGWPVLVMISTSPSGGCKPGAGVRFNQSVLSFTPPAAADSVHVTLPVVACPDAAGAYSSSITSLAVSYDNGASVVSATITARFTP